MPIDLHAHYLPTELVQRLRKRHIAPCIKPSANNVEHLHMPVGTLSYSTAYTDMNARLQYMKQLGIARQVLSLPGLFGVDSLAVDEAYPLVQLFNDDLIQLCRRHPQRFSGLAALPMANINAAIDELRRTHAQGLIGAILPNNAFLDEAHAAELRPLFEVGNELGVHFFIHPGRRPDEVGLPPAPEPADNVLARRALRLQAQVGETMVTLLFSPFLDAFPNISVHVANLGGTFPAVVERTREVVRLRAPQAPLSSLRARSVYVDCSSLGPAALTLAASIFGSDRIVLGTDCPIFDTASSLAAIKQAALNDDEQHAILRDNALRLLGKHLDGMI